MCSSDLESSAAPRVEAAAAAPAPSARMKTRKTRLTSRRRRAGRHEGGPRELLPGALQCFWEVAPSLNLTASLVLLRPTFCLVKDPPVIPVSKEKRKTGFPFALPLGLLCERVRVSFPRSPRPLTSPSLSRRTCRAKRAYKRGTVSPQDPPSSSSSCAAPHPALSPRT